MGNIIPEMGKSMTANSLCSGLFGKTRQAVLALLYGRADSSFYTKQILDAVKIGRGTVQRELKNLTDAGIIIREVQGRQVYYRANAQCPIFAELKGVVAEVAHNKQPLRVAEAPAQYNTMGKGLSARSKNIVVPRDEIAEFCRRNHIHRLYLFGSALRDDFRPDSDVDVLVEFESGHVPGFFRLFDMEAELSALFGGRKVDLRTPQDLSRYFRDDVLATAELHYAG